MGDKIITTIIEEIKSGTIDIPVIDDVVVKPED